jgi:hypothetical protein
VHLTEDRATEIGARISRVGVGRLELVQVNEVRTVMEAIQEPIIVPPELGDMAILIEAGTAVARLRDIVHGMIRVTIRRTKFCSIRQMTSKA